MTSVRAPYVPILAVEPSQLAGLAATSDDVKASLTPLFDVLPLRPDEQGSASAGLALDARIAAIAAVWGDRRAYVDCRTGRGDERLPDGRVHLARLIDEARERKLRLVPVTGLRRPTPYQLAVADAASDPDRGACLRLDLADFRDPSGIEAGVEAFLERLRLPPESIDLLVDLDEIGHAHLALLEVTVRAVLAPLLRLAPWRSVTLAGSAAAGRWTDGEAPSVARTEWLLWRALATSSPLGCRLRYGDHVLGERPALGGRWIHYTNDSEWLVLDVANRDAQHPRPRSTLSDLARRPEFRGPAHCAGDARFAERALAQQPVDERADPADWRAAATTHHLTVVVEQLAAL